MEAAYPLRLHGTAGAVSIPRPHNPRNSQYPAHWHHPRRDSSRGGKRWMRAAPRRLRLVEGMKRLINRFVENNFWMVPYVIKQVIPLQHEFERRFGHVFGVAQSVHPTNLIAVMRGDVDLDKFRARADKLEQDLGVEVKIVGV